MKHCWDFDIIYISYDEPNANENYKHLTNIVDHAKRVHGVKGIDAAHKQAAELANTEHFFVIDGDTKVHDWFFAEEIDIVNPNYVYSWSAENAINGLVYGNGGAKLWPKHAMKNIKSHETNGSTDFCWTVPYYQMDATSSITYTNTTPFQAFRNGFREGVRLSLDNGVAVDNPKTDVWQGNYNRLLSWMNVGIDAENGMWGMLGARIGCFEACVNKFDITLISDYDWLENEWNSIWSSYSKGDLLEYGMDLKMYLDLEIVNLDTEQSQFVKKIQHNPIRSGLMMPELSDETYLRKNGLWKDV